MRKHVLKPGDTHLMAPDEEYCRLVYEYQPNGTADLNIEVYDKSGVFHKSHHPRLSTEAQDHTVKQILGEGWDVIFAQDYADWSICCQKRPLSPEHQTSRHMLSTSSKSPLSRNAVLAALAICAGLLVVGWIAGQINSTQNQTAPTSRLPNNNDTTNDAEISGETMTSDAATIDPAEGEHAATSPTATTSDEDDTADDRATVDATEAPTSDNVTSVTADEDLLAADTIPAIALQTDDDPFVQAVRIAQETVLEGRVANSPDEWETLADRWQQAADLMETVPTADSRYEVAQDRIEQYENNRDAALSEAEKF